MTNSNLEDSAQEFTKALKASPYLSQGEKQKILQISSQFPALVLRSLTDSLLRQNLKYLQLKS
jgi:hypothetical protein